MEVFFLLLLANDYLTNYNGIQVGKKNVFIFLFMSHSLKHKTIHFNSTNLKVTSNRQNFIPPIVVHTKLQTE